MTMCCCWWACGALRGRLAAPSSACRCCASLCAERRAKRLCLLSILVGDVYWWSLKEVLLLVGVRCLTMEGCCDLQGMQRQLIKRSYHSCLIFTVSGTGVLGAGQPAASGAARRGWLRGRC